MLNCDGVEIALSVDGHNLLVFNKSGYIISPGRNHLPGINYLMFPLAKELCTVFNVRYDMLVSHTEGGIHIC